MTTTTTTTSGDEAIPADNDNNNDNGNDNGNGNGAPPTLIDDQEQDQEDPTGNGNDNDNGNGNDNDEMEQQQQQQHTLDNDHEHADDQDADTDVDEEEIMSMPTSFVNARKEQLRQELQLEKERKLNERNRMMYKIKHGMSMDDSDHDDEHDSSRGVHSPGGTIRRFQKEVLGGSRRSDDDFNTGDEEEDGMDDEEDYNEDAGDNGEDLSEGSLSNEEEEDLSDEDGGGGGDGGGDDANDIKEKDQGQDKAEEPHTNVNVTDADAEADNGADNGGAGAVVAIDSMHTVATSTHADAGAKKEAEDIDTGNGNGTGNGTNTETDTGMEMKKSQTLGMPTLSTPILLPMPIPIPMPNTRKIASDEIASRSEVKTNEKNAKPQNELDLEQHKQPTPKLKPKSDKDKDADADATLLYRHLKSGFEYMHREMSKSKPSPSSNSNSNGNGNDNDNDKRLKVVVPESGSGSGFESAVESNLKGMPTAFVESMHRMPLVNFIDPTSAAPSPRPSPTKPKRRAWNNRGDNGNNGNSNGGNGGNGNDSGIGDKLRLNNLHIFDKFDVLFHKQGCALQSVPYRNTKTKAITSIESLPIKAQLQASMVTNDPAEWHNGPICHVYIAACCSVEHYRNKVRPSLRAFVNQVAGAGSGNAASAAAMAAEATRKEYFSNKGKGKGKGGKGKNSASNSNKREQIAAANKAVAEALNVGAGSNTSSSFLILFVPVHPSSVEQDTPSPSPMEDTFKGGGLGLRRLAAAATGGQLNMNMHKRRNSSTQSSSTNSTATNSNSNSNSNSSSTHLGTGTQDDDSGKDDESTTTSSSGVTQVLTLSKEHKEVYRKFQMDFPNGGTSIFSSLLDSDNNLAADSPIQAQEFQMVLREMGRSVMSGFLDRLGRYNEEIERCENDIGRGVANWSKYFLVKESLAFTFEQMKLSDNAMVSYDELSAKLPKGNLLEIRIGARTHDQQEDLKQNIATFGNTEGFRKIVRSTKDMAHIHQLTMKYVFARHCHLLFAMKRPSQVLEKLLSYVKNDFRLRYDNLLESEDEDIKEDEKIPLQNEMLAISSCWDAKTASDCITSLLFANDDRQRNMTDLEDECRHNVLSVLDKNKFLTNLYDILNFAKTRLLKMSQKLFTSDCLLQKAMADLPADALSPWVPWNEVADPNDEKQLVLENKRPSLQIDSITHPDRIPMWLRRGMECERQYEDIFIKLCTNITVLETWFNRHRCASRLLVEISEIHILRGDLELAVQNILRTIASSANDPWDTLLSWRVFRLLCCQRKLRDEAEYFKSLTYCLGARLSKSIPSKLHHLLHKDLEVLVKSPDISGFRWTAFPLLGIKVELGKNGNSTFPLPLLKTNALVQSCQVGDSLTTSIQCSSGLAKEVEITQMKIFLLDVNDYQRLAEATDDVSEDDAAFVLSTKSPVTIRPGQNSVEFPWSAIAVGQYIVASICIEWDSAVFYHDYTRGPKGVAGYDILPNDPTQSIELNPIFLIPGHTQNVRLLFHSGSDVVNNGTIEFECSKGLQVMILETEPANDWSNNCTFDVGKCLPETTTTVTASVKSEAIYSYDSEGSCQTDDEASQSVLQTLTATMKTSYHHGLYASSVEEGAKIDAPPMSALLEASVTTLERAALTVENCGAFAIWGGMFVISATVLCNTPVPFSLKEWSISLPPSLVLDKDGDMNVGLFDRPVIEGEELHFGYRCKRQSNQGDGDASFMSNPILTIILQDHLGKSFRQVLPLDISSLRTKLRLQSAEEKKKVATAELEASAKEGLIGAPVHFSYSIDFADLAKTSASSNIPLRLLYHLSCVEDGWIVGGSVRGKLDYSAMVTNPSCSLSFVGIPTRVGHIKSFPEIELSFLDQTDTPTSAIKINHVHPFSFLCLSHCSSDSLACVSTQIDL